MLVDYLMQWGISLSVRMLGHFCHTVLFRVLMNFMIDFEIYRICLTQLKGKLKRVVIECIGVPI